MSAAGDTRRAFGFHAPPPVSGGPHVPRWGATWQTRHVALLGWTGPFSYRDQHEQQKLHFACKDWGFFQIINHGVAEELMQKMKDAGTGFFDLEMEEKQKYSMAENDIHGYGHAFVVSEDQKLDWADLMFLVTHPPPYKNLKYWPLTVPGFKETVEEYTIEISRVCEEIFGNLSVLMGLKEEGLKELHQDIKLAMRINYYPPCPKPDLVLGISPHSDGGSITILLQDDHITALQIHHHGHWIPVKPLPGALVVNVGDALEVWSNRRYKSVEHRAVTNESRGRMSIAMFVAPHDEAEMGPLEPILRHGPTLYTTIKCIDYARHYLSRKLDGKALDFLKIHANSKIPSI
ncbi:probable 2-oxoglutarate/Fe(II)-dependent dioxygenase [Neltuma alba]|uniref:probable 2-oxoglutarate/Fe(II)-dependent dioxygenase n=1 Tax=Neltuma alba TaxID=207710 RepID=UPI0010A354ED|nr:probable 2-oxoglutarate/Fe(II)-dependent dioxygenase [Prosopis alba]